MTERDYRYFCEVANCLNFTEAARKLYISQPALSKQIARLEEELGFPLFLRSKHEVTLAPGGVVILKGLGQLSEGYQELLNRAKLANEGKTGALRIGIQEGQSMDTHVLEQIRGFRLRYPQVALDVECLPYRELLNEVRQDRMDLALLLCFNETDLAGLRARTVRKMPSYIILAQRHPLAQGLDDLTVLNDLPLIVVGDELVPEGARFVLGQCEKCGIHPARTQMVPSYSTMYLRLAMGDGFSLMNQNIWYSDRDLLFFPLPEDLSVIRMACWRDGSRNPAVPLFLSSL